jgi:hypothetical protein
MASNKHRDGMGEGMMARLEYVRGTGNKCVCDKRMWEADNATAAWDPRDVGVKHDTLMRTNEDNKRK